MKHQQRKMMQGILVLGLVVMIGITGQCIETAPKGRPNQSQNEFLIVRNVVIKEPGAGCYVDFFVYPEYEINTIQEFDAGTTPPQSGVTWEIPIGGERVTIIGTIHDNPLVLELNALGPVTLRAQCGLSSNNPWDEESFTIVE